VRRRGRAALVALALPLFVLRTSAGRAPSGPCVRSFGHCVLPVAASGPEGARPAPRTAEAPTPGRPSRDTERHVPYGPGLRFDDEAERPLAASVYSLPSAFFTADAALPFLAAVRAAAPARTLLVLIDGPLRNALAARARALHLYLLDTHGRPYSPWPRDPFSFVRTPKGSVLVLVRPNLQPGREADAQLGPELVRDLPPAVDRAWGGVTWAAAPVPFHNGQVLLTRGAAWITLHTLEPRILALLGLTRVPVESFATAAGIERYVTAARRAADELAALYGRPARFVHPLPAPDMPLAAQSELMARLGGGAGYDLDSLVTFLPLHDGAEQALVADLAAGRALLPVIERDGLRATYDLAPAGDALTAALAAAQATPRATALASFLDLVAGHLAAQGLKVRRLPLLRVPLALLRDRRGLEDAPADAELLLTWNNVVAETRAGGVRAEGFAMRLPAGDRAARAAFAAAGVKLDLFPPLVHSVVLNGGYRCASNHVRAAG